MLGGANSTYAHHMKDARFTIPTPALLAKVVDMIEQVPMEDSDTKGDRSPPAFPSYLNSRSSGDRCRAPSWSPFSPSILPIGFERWAEKIVAQLRVSF